MEAVYACWMFDQRWACKLPNPCLEFALLVPATLNTTTVVLMLFERAPHSLPNETLFLALAVVLGLQTLLGVATMLRIGISASLSHPAQSRNLEVIRHFAHQYSVKRHLWGWGGLLTFLLCVAITVLNRMYLLELGTEYPCYVNQVRWYADLVGWGWITVHVVGFLLLKIGFLALAWRSPERYLRLKGVLQ